MVASGSLFIDVELFNSIEVGAFVVGVKNLHVFLYVAKCVLRIFRSMGVVLEGSLVFVISGSEVSTCLSYARFTAVRA